MEKTTTMSPKTESKSGIAAFDKKIVLCWKHNIETKKIDDVS